MQADPTSHAAAADGAIAIYLFLWVAAHFAFAWAGWSMARGKGQEPILGGVLGFFLGFLGLIIVLCLSTRNTASRSRRRAPGRGRTGAGRPGRARPATGRGTASHGRGTASVRRGTGGYRRSA